MKRVASLYLPSLSIDRLRRIDRKLRPATQLEPYPLVTSLRSGQRVVIAAACSQSRSLGLLPGMALTKARTLVSKLDIRLAEPDADAAFLERLGSFAAHHWTPSAAICGNDGLWLDLAGVSHLFGGEHLMCQRILRFCARSGFEARIAVASTTGAAHALARFGQDGISLCPSGHEAEAIAFLPSAALRLDDHVLTSARRFGIETIGELIAMPRGPLARRFGASLLTRLDQAVGRVEEPFEPIIPQKPPQATLRFLEPISSAEAIEQVLADLVVLLVGRLERRGLGARQVVLICDRIDGDEQKLVIGTVSATRDGKHLRHLLAMRVETIDPGFGIEAMHLVARRCESLVAQQIGGNEQDAGLPPLIDRIAGRIGSSLVFQCSAVESDVPERCVRRVPVLNQTKAWPRKWPRPARLLRYPEPVEKVIAGLPDQPPVRFLWRGKSHRIRKADGPERIYGEWWKHMDETEAVRDYFQVEDESGARFWLFRKGDGVDGRTGNLSWYIHGVFA